MKNFHLYPAIDIKNGKCVRLLRGDFKNQTIYKHDPVEQIEHFIKNGCKWVHIVDLNASIGQENNKNVILKIIGNKETITYFCHFYCYFTIIIFFHKLSI